MIAPGPAHYEVLTTQPNPSVKKPVYKSTFPKE